MRYRIRHTTTYTYQSTASLSHHILHVQPRQTTRQSVQDFSLTVYPEPSNIASRTDYYGNRETFLAIQTPHGELSVTAESQVDVWPASYPFAHTTPPWEEVRDACAGDVLDADTEAGEFLFDSNHVPRDPRYAAYASPSFLPGRPLLDAVLEFTARVNQDFIFDPKATNVATPVAEVFRHRRGVCQDFAHVAITCLRSLGLPARYVSGYIETLPPPGQRRLVGADASHAWFSVWCPGSGWIDVDPTNNVLVGERHVVLGWGRDFSDVTPMRGVVVSGGAHSLRVGIDVEPLY